MTTCPATHIKRHLHLDRGRILLRATVIKQRLHHGLTRRTATVRASARVQRLICATTLGDVWRCDAISRGERQSWGVTEKCWSWKYLKITHFTILNICYCYNSTEVNFRIWHRHAWAYSCAWVDLASAFINERLRSDCSVPAAHRPELVTTGLIVRQLYERPARSVPRFALITAPVLTFLFTGLDAVIKMNSVKNRYHAAVVLTDRTPACSNR